MRHLLQSEILRFRTLAITFAVVNLLFLRGFSAFYDLFAQDAAKTSIGFLIASLGGLAFGLYQIGSYKKLNEWACLIHRPLAPGKIFLALAGAAGILLFAVLALPLLLVTLYLDFFSPQWVDLRHYFLTPYLFGISYSFYLIGTFVQLSAGRAAFLVVALPFFFLTRDAVGLWIFLPQAVVILWLTYLCYTAFKPNLQTHVKRPLAVALTVLPTAYAILWILFLGLNFAYSTVVIVREHGWKGFTTFAWNDYFPAGTLPHVEYLDSSDAMIHALRSSDTERSRSLTPQIELADVFEAPGPRLDSWMHRHQLMFADKRWELADPENGIFWTFSHDRMLFRGVEMRSGKPAGWLGTEGPLDSDKGIDGSQRFAEVPYVIHHRYIVAPQEIYEYHAQRKRLDLRFELPEGEVFSTPLTAHGSYVFAKSDRMLYFFEPRDLERELGRVDPTLSVPIPGNLRNLARIQVAEMIDSYLISFLFGTRSERGFDEARQVVIEARFDGTQEIAADRPLAQGPPTWYRHRNFLVSPVLQGLHDAAWLLIAPHREERVEWREPFQNPPPPSMIGSALLVALLSAASTFLLARRRRLEPGRRTAWTLAVFVLSFPALISFLFLTSREEGDEHAEAENDPIPQAVAAGGGLISASRSA